MLKPLLRNTVWRMNKAERAIYLTFDDGPNPKVTPLTLEILEQFGAKATFFLVGENAANYPHLCEEIVERGHSIGNHTFNHLKGTDFSVADYVENVRKAEKYISSRIFRPPYGRITPKQVKALKADYTIVMWDIITYDYDRTVSPTAIIDLIKKRSRNGSIVVFHDSLKAEQNMLATLPVALKFWQEAGYTVKAIAQPTVV